MKTYKFKTLRGFLRACDSQVTAETLFSGRAYLSRGRGWSYVQLSAVALSEAAQLFAAYCVSNKSRRLDMAAALSAGRGDFSLFQCFYFSVEKCGKIRISNSLSGSSFEACKREYLRKYC